MNKLNLLCNEVDSHNLLLLTNRNRGQRYLLKEGHLAPMTRWESTRYTYDKTFRNKVKKEIKTSVSSLVKTIDSAVEKGVLNRDQTKEIFYDKFSRLNNDLFDRSELINTHIIKKLNPNYEDNPSDWKALKRTAKLAIKLGVKPELVPSGTNGTYFIKNLSGKKIAVFKPADEESLAENTPKISSKIKRFFAYSIPLFQTLIYCVSGNGCKSEAAASMISNELGLDNVPDTDLANLPDTFFKGPKGEKKIGSLQQFVSEECSIAADKLKIHHLWVLVPKLAQRYLGTKERREALEAQINQFELEKMGILDFVCGNIDRHFGNFFITSKGKIICFDNGNSLPKRHSGSWVSKLNQYAWGILPQTKKPLSDGAKNIIDQLAEKQEHLIQLLKDRQFIDVNQENTMRERIQALIKLKETTLYELSKVKSENDVNRILYETVKK